MLVSGGRPMHATGLAVSIITRMGTSNNPELRAWSGFSRDALGLVRARASRLKPLPQKPLLQARSGTGQPVVEAPSRFPHVILMTSGSEKFAWTLIVKR